MRLKSYVNARRKAWLKIILLMTPILLLISCSVPLTCHMYNNTGETVYLSLNNSDGTISERVIGAGKVIEIKEWEYMSYVINFDGKSYIYKPIMSEMPTGNLVQYKGTLFWGKRIINLKLERTGYLYVILNGDDFSKDSLPIQPEGYPIKLELM